MSASAQHQETVVTPLTEEAAGEVMTLQRAAFVSEAQIYGSADMPPLTQTLEQVAAELREAYGLPWDARRSRRYERAMSAVAVLQRVLPRRLRSWPARRYLAGKGFSARSRGASTGR